MFNFVGMWAECGDDKWSNRLSKGNLWCVWQWRSMSQYWSFQMLHSLILDMLIMKTFALSTRMGPYDHVNLMNYFLLLQQGNCISWESSFKFQFVLVGCNLFLFHMRSCLQLCFHFIFAHLLLWCNVRVLNLKKFMINLICQSLLVSRILIL